MSKVIHGLGIESRWDRYFSASVQTGPGATQLPIKWVPVLPRGKSGRGRGVDYPPSSAELKERVELYLYSPSGPSWRVLG
jgi:hypothetical protein